jgi:HEAT repeat protein
MTRPKTIGTRRPTFVPAALAALALSATCAVCAVTSARGAAEIVRAAPPPVKNTPATKPAAAEGSATAWLTDYNAALREAREMGRPVLLYAGADWCGPCRKLREELKRPEVRPKLAAWTCLYLDVDKQPTAAGMEFSAIPAVRLLTSSGRLVASQDGYVTGEEFARWLDDNRAKAQSPLDADLAASEPPEGAVLDRLVAALADPDAAVRESAVRRLAPHAPVAANAVVERFEKPELATRLAALELFQEWDAPVGDLDPWRAETITPARLKALKDWAAASKSRTAGTRPAARPSGSSGTSAPATKPASTPASGPAALGVQRLEEARQELDRLARGADESEARAAIERLARIGPALLPEVYDRLRAASGDAARERLTTLRYRLAASNALAVNWPAGLARLASASPAARHAAAEELIQRATPDDGPLLVELFSDPDPLVREISLRGIRTVGIGAGAAASARAGTGAAAGDSQTASASAGTAGAASGALARLLDDPMPNVRAAVLKELSSTPPNAAAVSLVVNYVRDEKDVDLLVHAVRVLREAKRGGDAARKCLVTLLGHESWRVRAEAAEALGKQLEDYSFRDTNGKSAVETALLKALGDDDGFVASRAVIALQRSTLPKLPDAMVKAAEKHPELTADIVAALRSGGGTGGKSTITAHLRRFCAHSDPAVRAAAIEGLASYAGGSGAAKELAAGLKDPAPRVRVAAAGAVSAALDRLRPDREAGDGEVDSGGGGSFLGISFGSSRAPKKRGAAAWLAGFRSGKDRPDWVEKMIEPLRTCVASSDPAERVWAASSLIAVGQDDAALPVLRDAARQNPTLRVAAATALPWLPPDKRMSLFDDFVAWGVGDGELGRVIDRLVKVPDPAAADRLWLLLADPAADDGRADAVLGGLRHVYFGDNYYNAASLPAARLKAATDAAKQKALEGPERQRVVALALLVNAGDTEAAGAASVIRADPAAPPALRLDALHVMLLCLPTADAEATAVAALSAASATSQSSTLPATQPSSLAAERKLAVKYLARGRDGLGALREHVYLYRAAQGETAPFDDKPREAKAPNSLKPEMLDGLLRPAPGAGVDEETAAAAGYLLCLLGRPEGLAPLEKYWREHGRSDDEWRKLVARAVAALGDDALTPLLEDVYAAYEKEDYAVREFYWAIRPMKGPNVMALRKKMRDELGMDRLR